MASSTTEPSPIPTHFLRDNQNFKQMTLRYLQFQVRTRVLNSFTYLISKVIKNKQINNFEETLLRNSRFGASATLLLLLLLLLQQIHPSISIYPSIHPSIRPVSHPSVYPPVHPCIRLFLRLFVRSLCHHSIIFPSLASKVRLLVLVGVPGAIKPPALNFQL